MICPDFFEIPFSLDQLNEIPVTNTTQNDNDRMNEKINKIFAIVII